MNRAATVDDYIASAGPWKDSLLLLREIFDCTPLMESIKWGMPVYMHHGKNVAGFSSFRAWTGIWFYQGVFLKDEAGVLINAQEGTTKGLRQWRFNSTQEIRDQRKKILDYLLEAIRNQELGKEIKPARNKSLEIPVELERAFGSYSDLRKHFDAFSLSNRREFAEYVGSAKREGTRLQRLEKIIPLILEGTGLGDKYRK